MSRLNARCESCTWGNLHALHIQLLEFSVVGWIFFIKLALVTNRVSELSCGMPGHSCTIACISLKGLVVWPVPFIVTFIY